jgi:hypothetical protein
MRGVARPDALAKHRRVFVGAALLRVCACLRRAVNREIVTSQVRRDHVDERAGAPSRLGLVKQTIRVGARVCERRGGRGGVPSLRRQLRHCRSSISPWLSVTLY